MKNLDRFLPGFFAGVIVAAIFIVTLSGTLFPIQVPPTATPHVWPTPASAIQGPGCWIDANGYSVYIGPACNFRVRQIEP